MDQIARGFITMFSAILVHKYNFNVYNVFFFLCYVSTETATTHACCRILGTPRADMCSLIVGRFCLFILGNGFVGISDLS